MSVLFAEPVTTIAMVSHVRENDPTAYGTMWDLLVNTAEQTIAERFKSRVVHIEHGLIEYKLEFITNRYMATLRSKVWKRHSRVRRRYMGDN